MEPEEDMLKTFLTFKMVTLKGIFITNLGMLNNQTQKNHVFKIDD